MFGGMQGVEPRSNARLSHLGPKCVRQSSGSIRKGYCFPGFSHPGYSNGEKYPNGSHLTGKYVMSEFRVVAGAPSHRAITAPRGGDRI